MCRIPAALKKKEREKKKGTNGYVVVKKSRDASHVKSKPSDVKQLDAHQMYQLTWWAKETRIRGVAARCKHTQRNTRI